MSDSVEPDRKIAAESSTGSAPASNAQDPDDIPLEETDTTDIGDRSGAKKFEGAEHRTIGDNVKLFDIRGNRVPDTSTYILRTIERLFGASKNPVTFGEVISMAGDFYTNRKPDSYNYAPISGAFDMDPNGTPEARFNDMIAAMWDNDYLYLGPLKDALDQEKSVLNDEMVPDGGNEAKLYHEGDGMRGDIYYTAITEKGYPKMAWLNADHFGDDALKCYKVGHALACQAAQDAAKGSNDGEKQQRLNDAYFKEAAANHYLTDLFSSGHLRTPRRAFHYDNFDTMTAVALKNQTDILRKNPESLLVWDAMCRVMHDDDSATGLLVKNAAGEQWIAFGDKQLFMPGNGVNRARAVNAVQKSVDEVYDYFKNPNRNVSKDTKFAILDDIPLLISNSRIDPKSGNIDSKWLNTMMDNPAPLWVPNENKASKTQSWTYRGQNDNHAAYTLPEGRPGFEREEWDSWTAKPECTNIAAASFRGEDQFPATKAVDAAGGILQITQTGSTWYSSWNEEFYLATCWTPVRFPDITYAKIPPTITVRNRTQLSDLYSKEGATLPIVHCLGFFDGTKTVAVFMRQPRSEINNLAKLLATAISFTDPGKGKPNQFNFSPGTKQEVIANTTLWSQKQIFPANWNTSVSLMDLRCLLFTDNFLPKPVLMSIVCGDESIYYGRTYLDDGSTVAAQFSINPWTKKTAATDPEWPTQPFVKACKTDSKLRRVLFCQHSATAMQANQSGSFNMRVAALRITDQNGADSFEWSQNHLNCTINLLQNAVVKSSCFLVGDVLGTRKWPIDQPGNQSDQVAAVSIGMLGTSSYTQVDVNAWREGGAAHLECQHWCSDSAETGPGSKTSTYPTYLRDYFIALIPSQFGADAGADVLHVSVHKLGDVSWLRFKTHVNDRATRNGGVVPGRSNKDYFGSCSVDWIQDDFLTLSRHNSGRYQSLKWLFLPHADPNQKNAIIEIFSWYGIIGFRYFAASWDGKKYKYSLVGVQPFNGQTSGTIGRGFYGTWGEGFMPLGTSQNFIDVNYYNMVLGGAPGHGYWDSANKDAYAKNWNDPGFKGDVIRRESDYVRGLPGDSTKLTV